MLSLSLSSLCHLCRASPWLSSTLLTTPLSPVLTPSKPSSILGPEIIFVTHTSILPDPSSEFFGVSHCPEMQPDLPFMISHGLALPYLSSPWPNTSRQPAFILHSQLVWTALNPQFSLMPLHMFICVGWSLCAGVLDRFCLIFQISKTLSHQPNVGLNTATSVRPSLSPPRGNSDASFPVFSLPFTSFL